MTGKWVICDDGNGDFIWFDPEEQRDIYSGDKDSYLPVYLPVDPKKREYAMWLITEALNNGKVTV